MIMSIHRECRSPSLCQSNLFNSGAPQPHQVTRKLARIHHLVLLSLSPSPRELIQYLSCESRAITSWRAGGRLEASSASAAPTPAAAEIAPLNDNATAAATTWVSARP